jgi:pyrroloquinoline quinone (PQQ) biosynthesis protein C
MSKDTVPPPPQIRSDRDFATLIYNYPDSDEAKEWFRFRVWAATTRNEKALERIDAVQEYLREREQDDHRRHANLPG